MVSARIQVCQFQRLDPLHHSMLQKLRSLISPLTPCKISWLLTASPVSPIAWFSTDFFFFLNACWICSVYMWPCAAQLVKSSHSFFGHFLCTWFHWERSLCLLVSCLIFISEEANFFLCFNKIFNLIFGAKVIAIFALLKFVFDIGIHT